MKKLITFILITISIVGYSQRYPKSYDPYTATNGHVFKVGDTIFITEPKDFNDEFFAVFDNKSLSDREEALYIYTSSEGKKSIYQNRYEFFTIRNFIDHPKGFKVAALDQGLGGLFNKFVAIDNAIEYDEIANCNPAYYKSIWGNKFYLTDSIAFLQYLTRESEITKDLAKEYLYLFQRNKYNLIREDEFEFHKGIKSTQTELNNLIAQQDTNKVYSILFKDEVENYDFDLESFPLKWIYNGTQIYNDIWEGITPDDINKDGVKLTDLRISFTNTADFNALPLDMDKANNFVKYKKDEYGNVDRDIFMKIDFRINGLSDGSDVTKSYFRGEKYLLAEILSIDFYAVDKERYIEYYHWWLNRMEK